MGSDGPLVQAMRRRGASSGQERERTQHCERDWELKDIIRGVSSMAGGVKKAECRMQQRKS